MFASNCLSTRSAWREEKVDEDGEERGEGAGEEGGGGGGGRKWLPELTESTEREFMCESNGRPGPLRDVQRGVMTFVADSRVSDRP